MDCFDDEREIISYLQDMCLSDVFVVNNLDDEKEIIETIMDCDKWKDWTASCGKNDPPPDFYCDSKKLMMDVMRVDDHSFIGDKGKIVNPYKMRESQLMTELKEKGVLASFPNAKVIFSPNTGLPTDKDHNYTFYISNFQRVVQSHIKKIATYQKKHPDYKTIFFIFDESSFYFEAYDNVANNSECVIRWGSPHRFFFDSSFLKTFIQSEIAYVIWFTPYKYAEDDKKEKIDFPYICVYNTRYPVLAATKYDEKRMFSYEK